jgi:hypothetical protein
MTLTKEDKINLSESRMQKAMEFLDDSRANLSEERIKTSVKRLSRSLTHFERD